MENFVGNPSGSYVSGGTYIQTNNYPLLYVGVNNLDFEQLNQVTLREEIYASNIMKELTQKYGSKGKSAKHIFLQAFNHAQQKIDKNADCVFTKNSGPQLPSCDAIESKIHVFMDDLGHDLDVDEDDFDKHSTLEKSFEKAPLVKVMARPAAMVSQSNFLKRLEEQVKLEIIRAGCPPPASEISWLNDVIQRETEKTGTDVVSDIYTIQDYSVNEPEEKMVARLKIYKRAFSALILHFEALRPIMREIKRNYDGVLSLRESQVTDATVVKKNIHNLELSLDQKMANVRFEGFKQMAEMEKQCFLLMRHVDKQDLAMRAMTDILNRLESSLSEEHDLRRDSEDQRKLLIVEINELRRKLGMAPRPLAYSTEIRVDDGDEEQEEEDEITIEDPIILRRALEITRNNLSEAHQRLTILEADYADVIPRHEFQELKVTMSALETEHSKTIETYDSLNSQIDTLKNQVEKLTGERSNLQDTLGAMRKRATPRPSWEKFGEHINGGVPVWNELIAGKSTIDILPILIHELTGRKFLGPPEYLHPLGTDSKVPKYLQYNNQIRLRFFSRRDVILVLQDIWTLRSEQLETLRRYNEAKDDETYGGYGSSTIGDISEEAPLILPFSDFITNYFTTRFHLISMRMEWMYNIIETCRKLGSIEPKLAQFLDILEGRLDESAYHIFRAQVGTLRNAVIQKSEETNQPVGSIQFGHFGQVLKQLFLNKSKDEFESLIRAASTQAGIYADFSVFKYISFFAMTDEGLIGAFIEELAKQFEEDRLKYAYEVLGEILGDLGVSLSSAERENDPAGETDVTMQQVFSAFLAIDPSLPDEKLASAISWIFMGNSTLPGAAVCRIRLVDYLRQHIRLSEFQDGEERIDDLDDDFERAITDILNEKEVEELEEMGAKTKKKWIQKRRVTNLGTVVRRLKGGAFVRYGSRILGQVTNQDEEPGIAVDSGNSGEHALSGAATASKGSAGGSEVKPSTRADSGITENKIMTPETRTTAVKKDKKKKKSK